MSGHELFGVEPCQACGAANRPGVSRCWKCDAAFLPASAVAAENSDLKTIGAEPGRARPTNGASFTLVSIFVGMTCVAMLLAMGREAPVDAMMLGVILLTAFVATKVFTRRRRRKGWNITLAKEMGLFLLASAAVAAVIASLTILAVITLAM